MTNEFTRPGMHFSNVHPRWLSSVLAGIIGGFLVSPLVAHAQPGTDQIARGEYLAIVGDCMSCHTAHDGQKFAGGRYMPTPFGPISTPNITPDKQTGIGNWTDDDFYHALHDGIAKGGEHLYPVMPYPWYTKVTRDDVLAIKAYLFSLPPANSPRPPNKLEFPFNVRAGLAVWDELFFHEVLSNQSKASRRRSIGAPILSRVWDIAASAITATICSAIPPPRNRCTAARSSIGMRRTLRRTCMRASGGSQMRNSLHS